MLSKRSVVTNLKNSLQSFLKEEMTEFKGLYPQISFSNLAFCYDASECVFSFSCNTAFDRNKAVLIYKTVDADFVRKNPKHWRYQDVALLDLIDEEHFNAYFGENVDDFYNIIVSELVRFMNSHVFKSLRKEPEFKASFVLLDPFESIALN